MSETCSVTYVGNDGDDEGDDMPGILDQIRNTTVADLEKVTGDFSDLPTPVYRPRVAHEMVRTVEGADDLRHPNAGRPSANAGMVRTDGTGTIDTRPYADQVGLPTERQRAYIENLLGELHDLDAQVWSDAMAYTTRMSQNRAWEAKRGGNVSIWIDKLKTKISELKTRPVAVVAKTDAWARWRELASKLAVVGGKQGTRFAIDTEAGATNSTAFWRITPSRDGDRFYLNQVIGGQGPVKVRMSPQAMVTIAEKIIAAGPVQAMVRYGLELGECGHCGRELTNDESRAAGIGPKCRKHMGGWH